MGCDLPPEETRNAYHLIVSNTGLEVVLMILSLVGLTYSLGFPALRAGASLNMTGSIVGLSTMAGYMCCCVYRGRAVFLAFVSVSCLFTLWGLVVVATTGNETPCVRHACFQLDVVANGTASLCAKHDCSLFDIFGLAPNRTCGPCDDRGRKGCDPKLSYYCSYDFEGAAGLGYAGLACAGVKWCAHWDEDCSKSGSNDNDWFWGFRTKNDCEDFYSVRTQRAAAKGLVLTAASIGLLFRIVAMAVLATSPPVPSNAHLRHRTMPGVQGIEMATVQHIGPSSSSQPYGNHHPNGPVVVVAGRYVQPEPPPQPHPQQPPMGTAHVQPPPQDGEHQSPLLQGHAQPTLTAQPVGPVSFVK